MQQSSAQMTLVKVNDEIELAKEEELILEKEVEIYKKHLRL